MEENDKVGRDNTGRHTQKAADRKAVEREKSDCMRQMILIEMDNWFRGGVANTASRWTIRPVHTVSRLNEGCF